MVKKNEDFITCGMQFMVLMLALLVSLKGTAQKGIEAISLLSSSDTLVEVLRFETQIKGEKKPNLETLPNDSIINKEANHLKNGRLKIYQEYFGKPELEYIYTFKNSAISAVESYEINKLWQRIKYLQGDSVHITTMYHLDTRLKTLQEYWSPDSAHVINWEHGKLSSESTIWNVKKTIYDYREQYYNKDGEFSYGIEGTQRKSELKGFGPIRVTKFEIDKNGEVIKEIELFD